MNHPEFSQLELFTDSTDLKDRSTTLNEGAQDSLPDMPDVHDTPYGELGGNTHPMTTKEALTLCSVGLGSKSMRALAARATFAREIQLEMGLSGTAELTPAQRDHLREVLTLAAVHYDAALRSQGCSETEIAARRRAHDERRRQA